MINTLFQIYGQSFIWLKKAVKIFLDHLFIRGGLENCNCYCIMASTNSSSAIAKSKDPRGARRTLAELKNLTKAELRVKAKQYGVNQTGKETLS